MNLRERLWAHLPDRCEIRKLRGMWRCPGKGIRGNENRIEINGYYIVMCDGCSFHWERVKRRRA